MHSTMGSVNNHKVLNMPSTSSEYDDKNCSRSFSSNEASFDSGLRSPDIFSDDDQNCSLSVEPLSTILRNHEVFEKRKIRKIEETLHGVLPPPWVTMLKTDAADILKKYYSFLPLFNRNQDINTSFTPTKCVSVINFAEGTNDSRSAVTNDSSQINVNIDQSKALDTNEQQNHLKYTSLQDNSNSKNVISNLKYSASSTEDLQAKKAEEINSKTFSATEARETSWPDVLKCRFFDVYYNSTKYSEKLEMLSLRFGERFIGNETDTSVNIHSASMPSPASAAKAKALRLKMSQIKSPGRRLSHLARRRQTFCSAATIGEKAQSSTSKMVLIDKNFFPHKKFVNLLEKKSPRRKLGSNTPSKNTTKKSALTPKTRSGGSSRKKTMRRLLLDSENVTRSQPNRETLKRALFTSPENRKATEAVTSSSVPLQAMRSKRMLFASPNSDNKLKRKLDTSGEVEGARCKIPKSLSFGGDGNITGEQDRSFTRRASELIRAKPVADLNELHKKKLLWAVSEALRAHGWRMSTPGFRERAAALARLTRRLLALPPHAARLAQPTVSTSDTMLKLARQYAFRIIQNDSIEDCFQEEKSKIENEKNKLSGYISAVDYQEMRSRQLAINSSVLQVKENVCINSTVPQELTRSSSKSVLQEKLTNSNDNYMRNCSTSKIDSMLSCEEVAKLRVRRQISFDDVDTTKR